MVRGVRYGVDVRLQLAQLVVIVHLDIFWVVDREELERIDHYEDPAGVSVDLFLLEARAQVFEQGLLVEVRQSAEIGSVPSGRGLREEAALYHPPPLLGHPQPHLNVAVVDGAVQVLLAQEEAVVLAAEAVLQCCARPEHHALHGAVARVQNPFLTAKLLHLGQNVEPCAVQPQTLDHLLDYLGGRRDLVGQHRAVDSALGQGARVHAHGEL